MKSIPYKLYYFEEFESNPYILYFIDENLTYTTFYSLQRSKLDICSKEILKETLNILIN